MQELKHHFVLCPRQAAILHWLAVCIVFAFIAFFGPTPGLLFAAPQVSPNMDQTSEAGAEDPHGDMSSPGSSGHEQAEKTSEDCDDPKPSGGLSGGEGSLAGCEAATAADTTDYTVRDHIMFVIMMGLFGLMFVTATKVRNRSLKRKHYLT